jgi:hypothetical protein
MEKCTNWYFRTRSEPSSALSLFFSARIDKDDDELVVDTVQSRWTYLLAGRRSILGSSRCKVFLPLASLLVLTLLSLSISFASFTIGRHKITNGTIRTR